MHERSFWRWAQAAALAAGVVLVGTGCGPLPETGGGFAEEPQGNFFANRHDQPEPLKYMDGKEGTKPSPPWTMRADRGYNGTIRQIGSSIDPRTPRTDGQQNISVWDEPGKMMQDRYSTQGGAAYSPTTQGLGGEDGAELGGRTYDRGAAGFLPLGWQDRNDANLR
ncbi:MAG TPA: hypothetical protein VE153_03400 [Myxococcus sp.]|nr:hypothetical protein [Myxococcus sp.]